VSGVDIGSLIPGPASGTENPTRIRSNEIGVPGAIAVQGSAAGPVTVTAMTSLTGLRPGSAWKVTAACTSHFRSPRALMSCSVEPNLSLGPEAISKTAWNVALVSMVRVPGMELASWRSGH